ncbi:LCP family protein [Clostridium celatum]|uniref:LCP family protein n=1 Tax=Clostridium celatum TaxID=36834 RepID=UPI00189764DE|nr:LCP family protein [Clostridium celatum]MDU2265134.1 LCP family protein [Clostridium celatum]MDU6295101.1 LCP family protein [Clostridium celatum]MDY3358895.1 LCP family protein [Clostridium celatum]
MAKKTGDNNENIREVKRKVTSQKFSARQEFERKKLLRKKAKRKATIKRAIAAAIITAILLIAFVAIYLFSFVFSLNNNDMVKGVSPSGNEPVNILLLGMDIGDTENIENSAAKRTDTMMLLNYNPKTDSINIVSIPRDTLIEVEDAYDAYGDYVPYWKMNAAYALGGEKEVIYQVQKLLDITVNYIVEIDYNAFRSLIDAIGGVPMYIDQDMYYDDDAQDLHINFTAGETVMLDGQKAEEFFRWRQNNDGTGLADGDLGRIKNQQKFIAAVIKKCTNPLIVTDVPNILKAIKENVRTNMPGDKIISYGLKVLSNTGMTMNTLYGYDERIYGQDFLVVEQEYNQDIIDILKNGNGANSSTVNKGVYSIKILNGTRVNGLAGNLQVELEELGYSNMSIGNGEETEKSVILCNNDELKQLLQDDIGINNIKKNKDSEYSDFDAVIIIGEDYLVFE